MLWRYLRASFAFRAALLAALFGAVTAGIAVSQAVRTHRRLQDFYPARANIQGKRMIGGRGGPSYSFEVRYRDRAGLSHERKVYGSRREYMHLRPGDEVPVYVSGVDPEDAWLMSAGEPSWTGARASGTIAAILLLPVGGVLAWLRRRVAVLRCGERREGRIEKVQRDARVRSSTRSKYVLLFSYTGSDGRQYRRRSLHMPKTVADRWRDRREIPVFVDPARPGRAEADVFGLREA